MSDITINYKGSTIATMDASGTKTLLTQGKYCEDDMEIVYVKPAGGGYTVEEWLARTSVTGDVVITTSAPATNYALANTKITSCSAPNLTNARTNMFASCSDLLSVSMQSYTSGSLEYTFYSCSSLTSVSLPSYASGSTTYSFRYCSSLQIVVFPNFAGTINSNTFRNCSNLTAIDCKATAINNNNNFDSTSLNTLILRGSFCSLGGINSFNNSPFASSGAGGTLYVPSSLKTQYEQASNWATILGYANNQIKTIEGSTYETHYADGTLIPT